MRAVVRVAPASEPPMSRRSGAMGDSSRIGHSILATINNGPYVFAGERAGQLALAQAVDHLHLPHVTRGAPRVEELAIERQVLRQRREQGAERGALDVLGVGVLLGIAIVEPVDVL